MFTARNAGLGDIMADLQGIAQLVEAAGTPGGVAGWFQTQLTAFQALPRDVQTIDAQVQRARAVLTGAYASTGALLALDQASADLATIVADYPAVQRDVQAVMYAMAPMMPALQAGTWTQLMAQPLVGLDLVGAFNESTRLLALRDDARRQLQNASRDPSLSLDIRTQLAQAIAAPGMGVLLVLGLVAVGGWLVTRKRRAQ